MKSVTKRRESARHAVNAGKNLVPNAVARMRGGRPICKEIGDEIEIGNRGHPVSADKNR